VKHLFSVLAAVVLTSTLDSAQVLPEGLGGVPRLTVIQGRVVAQDDATFPIRGARVELVGGSARADPVFTDADGRFAVGVPVPFTLRVTKAGYAAAIATGTQASGDVEVRVGRGAALTGRVADTFGFPVVGALVRARWLNATPASRGLPTETTSETDDNGEFRIGSLAAGRYEVNSERGAPLMDFMSVGMTVLPPELALEREKLMRATASSKPLSDPVTVDVSAGGNAYVAVTHHQRAVIPPDAPIGGSVSGTVVDEFGEPLQNVIVRLWRVRYADGRQAAEPAPVARRTNDLGQFRLVHVPPARYLVVATSEDTVHTPVFYPGTTAIGNASPIVVGRRQDHPGAHIVFTRGRHARLSGVVQGTAGERLDGSVSVIGVGAVTHPPVRVNAGPNGVFEFPSVAPGEYVVQAYRARSQEFGVRRVTVLDGDNAPVMLVVTPAANITGRVITDDGRAVPAGLRIVATLAPEYTPLNPAGMGNIGADGRFEIRGLMGPVLFALTPGLRGYRLKSLEIGAVNAAEERFVFDSVRDSRDDVTALLSSDVATISGTVTEADGRELDDYRVIVFPVDRTKWFTGSPYVQIVAGPNPDGRYVILDVPPGDYWLAAVNLVEGDATSGEWQNPDFLSRLAVQARRVSAGERQQVAADLRLIRR
jgi:hypothetical protein